MPERPRKGGRRGNLDKKDASHEDRQKIIIDLEEMVANARKIDEETEVLLEGFKLPQLTKDFQAKGDSIIETNPTLSRVDDLRVQKLLESNNSIDEDEEEFRARQDELDMQILKLVGANEFELRKSCLRSSATIGIEIGRCSLSKIDRALDEIKTKPLRKANASKIKNLVIEAEGRQEQLASKEEIRVLLESLKPGINGLN